jgi:hypothetical protein
LLLFAKCVLFRPPRGGDVAAELHRRTRLWTAGHVGELWRECVYHARKSSRTRRAKSPIVQDEDVLPPFLQQAFGADIGGLDAVPDETVRRVTTLARKGYFSKALAQLGAAQTAEHTAANAELLRALHPPGQELPPTSDPCTPSRGEPLFTEELVAQHLRKFKLGSAGGPSGLTPGHLLDMSREQAVDFDLPLAQVVNRIAAGQVPVAVRQYVFGASLTGLHKKAGGLRHVACGESLRRLAAKLLCAQQKERAKELFLRVGQFGVGVPGGIEAIVHGARAMVGGWSSSDQNVFVKLDFQNAFNAFHRTALLRATERHFPALLPYVVAAYGAPSSLCFGPFNIASEAGVQQGDPLGPLLFSAVLLDVLTDLPADAKPEFLAFFLDDGNAAGPAPVVAAFVTWIEAAAAKVGLVLNRGKSEIVCCGHVSRPEFAHFVRFSIAEWSLLGTPCGTEAHIESYVANVLARGVAKCHFIGSMEDSHIAYALLRLCASFPLAVYYARTAGLCDAFSTLDAAVRRCFASVATAPRDALEDVQIGLPMRLGGFGLRRSADFAAIAYVSSATASASLFKFMSTCPLSSSGPLLRKALACPLLAADAEVYAQTKAYASSTGSFGDKKQRSLSALLDDNRSKALVAQYADRRDLRSLARLTS